MDRPPVGAGPLPPVRYRRRARTMSTMMTMTTTVPMPIYMMGSLPLSG
jgi:hypothetical protein